MSLPPRDLTLLPWSGNSCPGKRRCRKWVFRIVTSAPVSSNIGTLQQWQVPRVTGRRPCYRLTENNRYIINERTFSNIKSVCVSAETQAAFSLTEGVEVHWPVWLNGMSGIGLLVLQCSDWFCRFYWSVNFFLLLLYEQFLYCVFVLLCAMCSPCRRIMMITHTAYSYVTLRSFVIIL